jgi:GNAT superfamily N-acetyltransferase
MAVMPLEGRTTARAAPALGSFRLRVGDIADVAVERLHALSVMVGWPHRPEDWALLRETGQGVAAFDGIGRVLATAMWFPFGPRFATVGMVITSPRLQSRGGGRWMMEHVLGQTRGRRLALNATRVARRLYASLGFVAGGTVYQRQGIAARPASAVDGCLRSVAAADLEQLTALDRLAYGADRSALMARLLDLSTGQVLLRGGEIRAFALCRRFGRGHVVGPAVAETDEDAISVVRPFAAAHAGQFLRVDTSHEEGAFPAFLAQSGLAVFDTVTNMSLRNGASPARNRRAERQPAIYALASHTVG